jgi:hypothetical protein
LSTLLLLIPTAGKQYQAKNDPIARELLNVTDGEAAARKAMQAQKAILHTCIL